MHMKLSLELYEGRTIVNTFFVVCQLRIKSAQFTPDLKFKSAHPKG